MTADLTPVHGSRIASRAGRFWRCGLCCEWQPHIPGDDSFEHHMRSVHNINQPREEVRNEHH